MHCRKLLDATERGVKQVEHPRAGTLTFERITMRLPDHPDLSVVLLAAPPSTG
ncbi:hypothetical protein ITP53_10680 [Nonomuraea sp. K274]|uniref:MmyB-like transcription regulator ligand binding domain-containing protein n=1 Tax=Nonomuraea cypriaca TaxID=1187855 RepID=A0A931F0C8_9ACTN|nr:hypothetical protein [Nonomuraea cypriaca]MBF8186203.1 hypothetical protein [Nonomuraea cypriaca]